MSYIKKGDNIGSLDGYQYQFLKVNYMKIPYLVIIITQKYLSSPPPTHLLLDDGEGRVVLGE